MYALHEIEEGGLRLTVSSAEGQAVSARMPAFYNPAMESSRDIGTLVAARFLAGHRKKVGCDLLSATGVRGLRYLSIGSIDELYINDVRKTAFELIFHNLVNNFNVRILSASPRRIHCLAGKSMVHITNQGAYQLLSQNRYSFDLVDVDPFGTPVTFIQQSLLSLRHGGLLGVTATDTATLCGAYPKTCLRRYGSHVIKTDYMHEVGLRVLIGYIARVAASLDIGIIPLLSHATAHYYRTYVEVKRSRKMAQRTLRDVGWAAHCPRCLSRRVLEFPPKPPICCGEEMSVLGPLWLGPLKNKPFVDGLSAPSFEDFHIGSEARRIIQILRDEEDLFSYFDVHQISRKLGLSAPRTADVIQRLRDVGYRASPTHITGTGVRTEAPAPVLREIVTELVRGRP